MLRRTHLALAVNLALGLAAGASALPQAFTDHAGESALPQAPVRPAGSATAVIRDVNGSVLGHVQIERYDSTKSKVTVSLRGLTAGFHGFHIHTSGVCDPKALDASTGSAFSSAGGHLDLGSGHDSPAGDLPSLLAASDGTASASFVTDRFNAGELADSDGSAIIVHAKPDNFANIPPRYTHPADSTGRTGPDATTLKTGDSGRRIGCGVIKVLS